MSGATKQINLQDRFDIELSILSKSVVAQTLPPSALPDYLTRDEQGTLRSVATGRRAFRGIGSVDAIDAHGEIVDIDAIKKTMGIMLDMGGIMLYNHKNIVAGRVLGWKEGTVYDEKLDKTFNSIVIDFELFDHYPIHKELERRMDLPDGHKDKINMLTIGGRKLEKVRECDDTKCWTRVTKIENHEFSLTEKGANHYAFIIEKGNDKTIGEILAKYEGELDQMSQDEPEIIDQTKLTLDIPEEVVPAPGEDLNKKADKKKPAKKLKKEDEEEEMKDEEEDEEEEDKDKDKDEKALEKSLEKMISKLLAPFIDRLDDLEKTGKVAPKTVKKDGFTYVLQKTVDADKKDLEEQIECLKKSSPSAIPQQSLHIHNEPGNEPTPLQKRAEEISKLSIEERISMAGGSARDKLENMKVFLQN